MTLPPSDIRQIFNTFYRQLHEEDGFAASAARETAVELTRIYMSQFKRKENDNA